MSVAFTPRTCSADLSFTFQVALVGYHDHGEVVSVLYAEHLLVECADFLERAPACDAVHEEEPLAGAHVLLAHCAVLFLACRVEHIEQCWFFIDDTLLSVGVCGSECMRMRTFDGRIILIHKLVLHELDGEGRLPYPSPADHDELVFTQDLGLVSGNDAVC